MKTVRSINGDEVNSHLTTRFVLLQYLCQDPVVVFCMTIRFISLASGSLARDISSHSNRLKDFITANRHNVVCHRHSDTYLDHIMSTKISPPRVRGYMPASGHWRFCGTMTPSRSKQAAPLAAGREDLREGGRAYLSVEGPSGHHPVENDPLVLARIGQDGGTAPGLFGGGDIKIKNTQKSQKTNPKKNKKKTKKNKKKQKKNKNQKSKTKNQKPKTKNQKKNKNEFPPTPHEKTVCFRSSFFHVRLFLCVRPPLVYVSSLYSVVLGALTRNSLRTRPTFGRTFLGRLAHGLPIDRVFGTEM